MLDQILFHTDCTQQECAPTMCVSHLSVVMCVSHLSVVMCVEREGEGGRKKEREKEKDGQREREREVWSNRMDTN